MHNKNTGLSFFFVICTKKNTEKKRKTESCFSLSSFLCLLSVSFSVTLWLALRGLARFGKNVRFDLVGIGEAVHQIEQADDGQHFA